MQFKAVLWDFGGVITSSPFDAFNAYERERGLPENLIRRINATDPDANAWAKFERNEIGGAEFDELFATEAAKVGFDVRGADVIALLSGTVRPRMVAALDACKTAGFRLGCITNNAQVGHGAGMSTNESRAAQMADAMSRFEHVIESSKSGIRKPDPRIYLMICAALDVAPDACVYLDDLGINCKPAAALGMTAIKVNGEHQALDDLGRVLGMTFG